MDEGRADESTKPDSIAGAATAPAAAGERADVDGGAGRRFVGWATRLKSEATSDAPTAAGRRWRAGAKGGSGSRFLVAVVLAGAVSVVLAAGMVGAAVRPRTSAVSAEPPAPASVPGDPALAARLADEANAAPTGDSERRLRLLLAAHVADPDSSAYVAALAEVLLAQYPDQFKASVVAQHGLGGDESIRFASASADTSFLVVSGARNSSIWRTRWHGDTPQISAVQNFLGPVSIAGGAGTLTRGTVVLGDRQGVQVWMTAYPSFVRQIGDVAGVDGVAVAADGNMVVSVDATAATLWQVDAASGTQARASLSYPTPVTAMAFSATGQVLVGGHADGAVTVHSIGYPNGTTSRRELAGQGVPVNAVAVSADAATALAVGDDGSLSVWNLVDSAADGPAATVNGALHPGVHRAWLSATGDVAILAEAGSAGLWSLADREHPRKLADLGKLSGQAVPAMVSADGRRVLTIARDNTLTIFSLDATMRAVADPVAQACQIAHPSDEQWRQMLPDPAMTNPCQQVGPPHIDQPVK